VAHPTLTRLGPPGYLVSGVPTVSRYAPNATDAPAINPHEWDALHDAARDDLGVFTQLAWPELNRGTPMIWARHNEAICEHLEAVSAGEIRKLIICVPPGHSKTTHAAQAWPVWHWL
jgi:hypothetical protein